MFHADELEITKLLVYGTSAPGSDPNSHIRSNNAPAPSISFSMQDYLSSGAGRYARPSEAPLIQAFFADANSTSPLLADGNYTAAQVRSMLGLDASTGALTFGVSQYTTDAGSSDFIERSYIFGSTDFLISDSLRFVVAGGNYSIENMELIARPDDFDFQSSNPIASGANIFLRDAFAPYGLIPEIGGDTTGVVINFTGGGGGPM